MIDGNAALKQTLDKVRKLIRSRVHNRSFGQQKLTGRLLVWLDMWPEDNIVNGINLETFV